MQWYPQFKRRCWLNVELCKSRVENGAAKLSYRPLPLWRAQRHADIVGDVNVGTSKTERMRCISDTQWPVSWFITDSMASTVCQYLTVHCMTVQHTHNNIHHHTAMSNDGIHNRTLHGPELFGLLVSRAQSWFSGLVGSFTCSNFRPGKAGPFCRHYSSLISITIFKVRVPGLTNTKQTNVIWNSYETGQIYSSSNTPLGGI